MSPEISTVVAVSKAFVLVLGGLVTYHAYRASRRTGSHSLRLLAFGFGTVTLGALLAGVVDVLLPLAPSDALLVESLFTLGGFALVLYSLHVD